MNFDAIKLANNSFLLIEISISEACSAGTYRPTDETECVTCEEGSVSTETGATSCTSCDPGKQANSDKTLCGECATYNDHLKAYSTSLITFLVDFRRFLYFNAAM